MVVIKIKYRVDSISYSSSLAMLSACSIQCHDVLCCSWLWVCEPMEGWRVSYCPLINSLNPWVDHTWNLLVSNKKLNSSILMLLSLFQICEFNMCFIPFTHFCVANYVTRLNISLSIVNALIIIVMCSKYSQIFISFHSKIAKVEV